MIAAMGVDEPAITVVKVEIAGQLFGAEFSGEAAVAVSLLFGQKTDGHGPPPSRGEAFCKTYKFCEKTRGAVFPQNSICKSIPQKVAFMQELLQNTGEE